MSLQQLVPGLECPRRSSPARWKQSFDLQASVVMLLVLLAERGNLLGELAGGPSSVIVCDGRVLGSVHGYVGDGEKRHCCFVGVQQLQRLMLGYWCG